MSDSVRLSCGHSVPAEMARPLLAAGHAVRCPRCRVLRLPAAADTRTSAERLMDDMKSRRR